MTEIGTELARTGDGVRERSLSGEEEPDAAAGLIAADILKGDGVLDMSLNWLEDDLDLCTLAISSPARDGARDSWLNSLGVDLDLWALAFFYLESDGVGDKLLELVVDVSSSSKLSLPSFDSLPS